MDAKILRLKDIGDPQHVQVRVTDVIEGADQESVVMTIYTGTLMVQHGTGQHRTPLIVQVPVVALVQTNPPQNVRPGTKAIFTFDKNHFPQQFRGAIATASIASFRSSGDEDAVVAVESVVADLREVRLNDLTHTLVHAVVLTLELQGQNSEVIRVAYQVTVLSVVNRDLQQHTVREGDNGWDGTFTQIGLANPFGVPHP